jgi:hypothetical protein
MWGYSHVRPVLFLEVIMFDLKNCVTCDGEIYCWHPFTNSIVKVNLQSVPVKDCPESLVEMFLEEAFAKKKAES